MPPTHRSVKGFIVTIEELEKAVEELEMLALTHKAGISDKPSVCQMLTHRLLVTNGIGFVDSDTIDKHYGTKGFI